MAALAAVLIVVLLTRSGGGSARAGSDEGTSQPVTNQTVYTSLPPSTPAAPVITTTTLSSIVVGEQAKLLLAENDWSKIFSETTALAADDDGGAAYTDFEGTVWEGAAMQPEATLFADLGGTSIVTIGTLVPKINSDFNALRTALGLPPVTFPPLMTFLPNLQMTISGTGPANAITLDVDNQIDQHTDVVLPYIFADPTHLAGAVSISAQDGSGAGGATITCTITEFGKQVATNTATGPYAIAECTAPS
ncbi:MAG: hypothetical protein ACRDYC_01900 [Acidimicrobiales bacterium]